MQNVSIRSRVVAATARPRFAPGVYEEGAATETARIAHAICEEVKAARHGALAAGDLMQRLATRVNPNDPDQVLPAKLVDDLFEVAAKFYESLHPRDAWASAAGGTMSVAR